MIVFFWLFVCVVFFLRFFFHFFFFFCLRTIKFFSLLSKLYSCVFLGDFITCGVHVREGFCEKGVYFNEHNTTRCFTKKKSREKLFLVSKSSFFVGIIAEE